MDNKFYYSFNIDNETGRLSIGVDDVLFSMGYADSNDIDPVVRTTSSGYNVFYRNIYDGIDIEFVLDPTSIKEFIYVKNADSKNEFYVDLDIENGYISYERKKKQHNISDRNSKIMFSLPDPYIVDMENRYLKNFVKLKLDKKNNRFRYTFDHRGVKKYPIKIDPSFVFNTKIKNHGGVTYGIFDSQNKMIVTGNETAQGIVDEISELALETDGQVKIASDDVVFEENLVLIFPEPMAKKANVILKKGNKTEVGAYDVVHVAVDINGEDVIFSGVFITIPFSSPGSVDVSCSFPDTKAEQSSIIQGGSPYVFFTENRGYPVITKRKFTYLPKIDAIFNNQIDCFGVGSDEVLNIKNLLIRNVSSFKPFNYSIIPYTFKINKISEGAEIANSPEFLISPNFLTRNSFKYLSSSFDLSFDFIPETDSVTHDALSWLGAGGGLAPIMEIGRGHLKSFVNDMDIVLHSALNHRDNLEQGRRFKRPYTCINDDDILLEKIDAGANDLKNIKIKVYSKPFMYFILDEGVTFDDYFSYCSSLDPPLDGNLEITENSSGNTDIIFKDKFLKQDFTGTHTVEGVGDFEYNDLSNDILNNCSFVIKVGNKISSYNILSNAKKQVTIRGRRKKEIMNAGSFCILLFDPNKAFFDKSSFDYGVELEKENINTDGTVSYKDIIYDTDFKTGIDNIVLHEKRKKFTLTKPINLYSMTRSSS